MRSRTMSGLHNVKIIRHPYESHAIVEVLNKDGLLPLCFDFQNEHFHPVKQRMKTLKYGTIKQIWYTKQHYRKVRAYLKKAS